jgi:hypothetical protein
MREPRWIRQTRATFSADGWAILAGAAVVAAVVLRAVLA